MPIRALELGAVWPSEVAGGGDRVFADLAKYLPQHGVAVEALFAGSTEVPERVPATLSTFAAASDGTKARWQGARQALATRLDPRHFDLFASHFALYASAALGGLRRLPHVVHFHGPWAAESRQEGAGQASVMVKWAIERAVYSTASRFIVLSKAFAELAARDYRVPMKNIRVVPGAADLDRFLVKASRVEARRQLGWPTDRPMLVTVRRLVRRTGVDRLVEAMPKVKARVPGVMLFIGGTGALLPSIKERVRELGLEECVRFLGYVSDADLPLAYRAADFNVLPTVALEGFGLTAAEALAAGTPSIVTPIGGLPEVVADLSPDLVLKSTAPDDIADGLIRALSSATSFPSEGECRAYAVERFSADRMAKMVASVYEEICP